MAGDTIITVIGNLTADPELRWGQSGTALASFTIASTPRSFDRASNSWKDGEALFLRCTAWRELAENRCGIPAQGVARHRARPFTAAFLGSPRRFSAHLSRDDG